MSNIFFTSDHHFNHAGIIEYCERPFKNVWAMNTYLIDKWNEKITNEDTVYYLGDFGFGDCGEIIKQLRYSSIQLIRGDHDKNQTTCFNDRFHVREDRIFEFKAGKWPEQIQIILCHWCMRAWPRSHYGTWHLFAHSHGRLEPIGKSWDAGVDNNNFEPLSLDEISDIMRDRPNNPNLVKEV